MYSLFRGNNKPKRPTAKDLQHAAALRPTPLPDQPIELGTIHYQNLTADGRHGDYEAALHAASPEQNPTGKPLFCNFVEWTG